MASVTFTDGLTWPDPQRDHLSLVSRKVGPFLAVIPGPSGVDIANRGHVIPGATAYDLLGNTKALLWYLGEVIDYLPQGLQASLRDDRIRVYDRDPYTGADRDPATQVALATDHLRQLRQLVGEAAAVAEAAQTALNSQGWNATAALEDA